MITAQNQTIIQPYFLEELDPFIILDSEGNLVFQNKSIEKLLQRSSEKGFSLISFFNSAYFNGFGVEHHGFIFLENLQIRIDYLENKGHKFKIFNYEEQFMIKIIHDELSIINEDLQKTIESLEMIEKNGNESLDLFQNYESYYISLLENTKDLIWSVDKNFKILALNSATKKYFFKMYGILLKEGDNIIDKQSEALTKEEMVIYKFYYEEALKGNSFETEIEIKIGGEKVIHEVSFNPITTSENIITGVSVFSKDISKRVQQQIDLLKSKKNLETVNKELDTFVYKASHDLKGPVSTIMGLLNLIKMDQGQNPQYMSMLEHKCKMLNLTLDKLINATHVKENSLTISKVYLEDVINEVVEELKMELNKTEVLYDFDLNGSQIHSDYKLVKLIFSNIIQNSLTYTSNKVIPAIKISSKYVNNTLEIKIKDNGEGIEKEALPNVFNMFYRGSIRSEGSGLGLYLTNKAVDKLNGKIKIKSKVGNGTTLKLQIPDLDEKLLKNPVSYNKLVNFRPFAFV
jgi:PAS domain S-box-containing protein